MSPRIKKNLADLSELLHSRLVELAEQAEPLDAALADEIRQCKLDLANKIAVVLLELQLINRNVLPKD